MKRLLDAVFSFAGLLLLSPLFIWIAFVIKKEDGGPVFYRGLRVGRYGIPFEMLKFRTMVVDAGKMGGTSTADDDPRLTRIGKILRKYKLDEIPQFINVLKGDMSLVGPRPQVQWAVELYSIEEKEVVLSVRPGMTDYASLYFYNEGEILKGSKDPDRDYMDKIHAEKMRLSMEYVREMSIITDFVIILKTLLKIIKN